MAAQASQVLSAQRAVISIAPVGTTMPVDLVTPLAVAFLDVGHTTPDSLTLTTTLDTANIASHQSDYDIRVLQTSAGASFAVGLLQWNSTNLKAALGGGTVTMVSTGVYKFTPPAIGARAEFAVVIEVQDNENTFRYCIPRAIQVEGLEISLQKGTAATLPLNLQIQGGDNTDAFWILSNMPSMAPPT